MAEVSHHVADLDDVRFHYVTAGEGEPVVLLHGWPQTWFVWRHVIPLLAEQYYVVVPDLPGFGDSSGPSSGFDKRSLAADVWRLVHDVLGIERFSLVGHSWGSCVGYALAAAHPDAVRRLVMVSLAPPREGNEFTAWHQLFAQVHELPEALVQGREEIFFGWFWRNIVHPSYELPAEAIAEYLRTYRRPENLRASFEYYRALPQDMADNTALARDFQLPMPVLAVGFTGPLVGVPDSKWSQNHLADKVRPLVHDLSDVLVDECGYVIPEEKPHQLAQAISTFFEART